MIIVYTSDDCKWCQKVKDLLTEVGLTFEERNVRTQTFRDEWSLLVKDLPRKTVPQVVVEGKHVGGYESTKSWVDTYVRPS